LFRVAAKREFGTDNRFDQAQFSRYSVVERARFFEPTISRIAAQEAVDPYLCGRLLTTKRDFARGSGLMPERKA
jgi:hypothetical protein